MYAGKHSFASDTACKSFKSFTFFLSNDEKSILLLLHGKIILQYTEGDKNKTWVIKINVSDTEIVVASSIDYL